MKISEAIERIKSYHCGIVRGAPIDPATSRDQILYGDPERELTGIVTTCHATVDVIRKAKEVGANLIITHEALFWNHGDHTDWLQDNKTFQAKAALLDEGGITVWRDHDHMHSGIPVGEEWVDGIYYGVVKHLGWEDYCLDSNMKHPRFEFPEPISVQELGKFLMEKLGLNGIQVIGSMDTMAKRVWICGHIFARNDNETLKRTEEEDIDTLICLECVDHTVVEYIRDSDMVGRKKTILHTGHFNTEEPGMRYMVEWLPEALGEYVPITFAPCADMYQFIV